MKTENKTFECSSCSKEPTRTINISRFISHLDSCFARNDLNEAVNTVKFWKNEAKALNDRRGLISVLNEELGLYRRLNDKENASLAISEISKLLSDLPESRTKATILVNLATTLKAFDRQSEAMPYYEEAERLYKALGMENTYEFAAMLNNKSSLFIDLKQTDEAESCLMRAIDILKALGSHGADIALSIISLCHMYYDFGIKDTDEIEELLDSAWEHINDAGQKRDSLYAFAISKCAPSFRYFKRETEAMALEETALEIYGGK